MPRQLKNVLTEFLRCVREAREITADAYAWSIPTAPATKALITIKRRDLLAELAFFRVFSAWEAFIEEAFILYLLGYQSPKGRKVSRYGFPPTKAAAYEWVSDGRSYAIWSPEKVKPRATRLFKGGRPFNVPLSGRQNLLGQLATVRNAIAHNSANARVKFEAMVRNELKSLPPSTTPGSFLLTTKAGSSPPMSYFEFYLGEIKTLAEEIVPT